MWDLEPICRLCARGLRDGAERADGEQATAGIDALDELGLHVLLREGLADRYGVLAEQRYPGDRSRTKRSEGERCDIVVTRELDTARNHLVDPLEGGTLFEGAGVDPGAALWLEVKVAHLGGAGYGGILRHAAPADLSKLAKDDAIEWGAVALVMYAPDECAWRGDVERWRGLGLVEGWPIGGLWFEGFPITDRMGAGYCGVVVAEAR